MCEIGSADPILNLSRTLDTYTYALPSFTFQTQSDFRVRIQKFCNSLTNVQGFARLPISQN